MVCRPHKHRFAWNNQSADPYAQTAHAVGVQLTTPGIPCIYYGTEQAFDQQRAAMFAEGTGSGGVDHYDTDSEMYKHIQAVTALRKSSPVFSSSTNRRGCD